MMSSYNFREYFMRRTRDSFRAHLFPETSIEAKELSKSAATLASVPTSTAPQQVPTSPLSETSLKQFYENAQEELKALQRAAVTNMMYAGSSRLVVEDQRMRDWVVRTSPEAEGGAGGDAEQK
ncbi:hypothetical protein MVES1_003709 [Malassezia vespertilionis]|uniref:uncharacterized protein n=1 Tax=Malassezia vespertilionis TaxID=2020962 RepID=UPI0024B1DF9F|nr:uncharacterized protein MVES1_003709 [Malassezia vespertilionis]WFD08337.1 hypothetical protein MVES1_003709 [Malassezia vespertilionis]